MIIEPFQSDHLKRLRLQPAQQWCAPHITDDLLAQAEQLEAYTGLIDSQPVIVAGLMEFWPGRALAWSFVSADASAHMLSITKAVDRVLTHVKIRRIEAYVDPNFSAGLRWIEMLGFQREGHLTAFLPDGRDQVLFSRVRHE